MKKVIETFTADDKGTEREVQLVEENGKLALYATFTDAGLKKVNCPDAKAMFETLKQNAGV